MIVISSKLRYCLSIGILFCVGFIACTTVKNFPPNQPFVYSNKIELEGNVKKDAKKQLVETLNNYWDDSLLARKTLQFGVLYKLKNPPKFDTANITRTTSLMNAYLNSQGYYYANLTPNYTIDTVDNQLRTNIAIQVKLGKSIAIDSVSYQIFDTSILPIDSSLQKLTLSNSNKSLLKKNAPYTKQNISSELERLTTIYRRNGYFKFNRENLYVLVDTLDANLLQLTVDPLQQINLLQNIDKKRKENPNWDITVLLRNNGDTNYANKFYVGNIYYYPDIKNSYYNADSLIKSNFLQESKVRNYRMRYTNLYTKLRPLREHTYLKYGSIYNEDDYYKSLNRLCQIAAWKQVDVNTVIRNNDSIDFHFFMIPEKKYGITLSQEVSRNTGDIASGNLLGVALNATFTNRNVWKQAIQSLTTARVGFEFNIGNRFNNILPLVQTRQLNISHTFNFPRIIQPFKSVRWLNDLENKRTLISISGNYTDRTLLYTLRSLVTSFGWEASYKDVSFLVKPLNIELYRVDTLPGLLILLQQNPFLRNSFRNGNVVGTLFSVARTFNSANNANNNHFIRFGFEESGIITNWLTGGNNNLFNYVKLEGEYKYLHKYYKTELATRFFVGTGLPRLGQAMPIFKQYFMGGPNSMRAWGLRQLGLGSSKIIDTTTAGISDRFGDFILEANIEYRFTLATIAGIKIASALYSDVGNLWNISSTSLPETKFSWRNIGKDIAIGVGTGVRLDFNYFLLRFDFAYKVKDPARPINGGWMSIKNFEWTNTRENNVQIPNYAFQFGIGLPF